jgi:hypothetical protein
MRIIHCCIVLFAMAAALVAQTPATTPTSDSMAAADTSAYPAASHVSATPSTGHGLRYPRATWAVAAGAGICAITTGYCVVKANRSYDRYQAAAAVDEMGSWRAGTARYDRVAYAAGLLTTGLASVALSLFCQRQDGIAVGMNGGNGGQPRCAIVWAGRF